jgi:hypothetical protein
MKNLFPKMKHIMLGVMVSFGSTLWAQYSILQTGLSSDWSFNDLMSCTVINGSNKTPLVYLNCTVSNSTKKVVLRAQSNIFSLNKGSNLITRADVDNKLLPIKTLFVDAKFRSLMDKTAMPEGGNYEVRLDLVEKIEKSILTYSQSTRNVNLINPFRLITPFDGSQIDNLNPTFTWTRPMNSFGQEYAVKVVEVYKGQSIAQALRSNPLLIKQEGLDFNLFQTPYNGNYLESCKKYAWQVEVLEKGEAKNILNSVSEVWSFSTSCESRIQYKTTPFYVAKNQVTTNIYPAYDTLRVALDYSYTDVGNVKASILDARNQEKTIDLTQENEEQLQSKKKNSLIYVGDNRFVIPLVDKRLVKNKHYLLRIQDGVDKYFISFEYLGE